jgi:hypothetical protein
MAVIENETLGTEGAGDFDRAALEALDVDYRVQEDFSLADIDVPGSRQVWEQVRPGEPLDEENVEQLRTVVENGGILPPIIVYRDNREKWRVISGNHRTEMYRQIEQTKIRAYVATGLEGLKFENGAVLALAFEANAGHGKQVAEADRLKQALDLVHKGGYEIKDAARALAVKESKLRDEKEKVESTYRLEMLGVDTEPIPVTARRRIASIRADELAKKLGELVPLMDQKVVTVEETVKAVNSARSEQDAAAILAQLSETLHAENGKGERSAQGLRGGTAAGKASAVSPVLRHLNRVLGTVANLNIAEIETAGTTSEYRKLTLEKIDSAITQLSKVKDAL